MLRRPGQGMTISDLVARHARRTPDGVLVRFAGRSVTYRHADERATRLGNALRSGGVGKGDRVAVLTLNNPETLETYIAVARIGAVSVPINCRLSADEIAYILADSDAKTVVVDSVLAPLVAAARRGADCVRSCLVIGEEASAGPGSQDFGAAVTSALAVAVDVDVEPDDPFLILYTSGTTGRPKGAVIAHSAMLTSVTSQLIHLGIPRDCRSWAVSVPMFHIAAVSLLMTAIYTGGRVVLDRLGGFDPVAMLDIWERERVGVCFLVPSQWEMVCGVVGDRDRDLSALQVMAWGAAPATPALLHRIMETFPSGTLFSSFGMTETSSTTTVLLAEDAVDRIGSVGTPMINVETRVVDSEMNDVAVGEVGEIVYRGPILLKEYWNNPEATAAAFVGGWFHSGDLVRQDADGFIYVVDRLKDMIISGGENIYCAEVENAVAEHPEVAEVAVVGAADPDWGEIPVAVVVPRDPDAPPTLADIAAWCAGRLAAYKRPKRLVIVEELPRNASGKVVKTTLRARV